MRNKLYPGKVERVCPQCGDTFFTQPSFIKLGQGIYCEQACYFDAKRSKSVADRFWPKVDKNGPVPAHMPHLGPCWLWTGARLTRKWDYGKLGAGPGKSPVGAHAVSWELHFGSVPQGLWVLHHCDKPPCVNPSHLFLGTAAANTADMVAKGRARGGRSRSLHAISAYWTQKS